MSLINANTKQRIVVGNRLPIVLSYNGTDELTIDVHKSIIPLLESIDPNMRGIRIALEGEMTRNIKYQNKHEIHSIVSKTGHWAACTKIGNLGYYNNLNNLQQAIGNDYMEIVYNTDYDDVKDSYLTEFINWTNNRWRPHYISVRATIRYDESNMTRTYIYSNVVRVYLD